MKPVHSSSPTAIPGTDPEVARRESDRRSAQRTAAPKRRLFAIACATAAMTTTAIFANFAGVPVPAIPWLTLDNGGTRMFGETIKGDLVMVATVAQPDASPPGASHGGGFTLASGFWHDHTLALTTCLGDVAPTPNGDGFVNVADLLSVVDAWGTAGPDGDADGNNIVNVADLLMVIAAWGTCPP